MATAVINENALTKFLNLKFLDKQVPSNDQLFKSADNKLLTSDFDNAFIILLISVNRIIEIAEYTLEF